MDGVDSAGLTWPLPEGLNDGELEAALYANRRSRRGHRRLPEPNWPGIHRELKRKHVTLLIVWDKYIAECPPAIGVTRVGRSSGSAQDACLIGPATAALCELILEHRPHPEQGFRACLGIVRLASPYGADRVEAAAERAIEIGARTYGSVKSILDNNLDRRPAPKRATDASADPTSQHPWSALLPIRRNDLAQTSQPSISFTPWAFMAWPRPSSKSPPPMRPTAWAILNGSASCSIAKPPRGRTSASSARLRDAKLRQQACVEDIDYRSPRGLDRVLFQKLIEGDWIDAHDNLALIGPTGVGKSWLACAARPQGLPRQPLRALCPRAQALRRPRPGPRRRPPAAPAQSPRRADLLILDDWGLEPLDARPAMISSKSSKTAMAAARPSSPPSFLSTAGMRSSATPPTPTPSSIASSTTPTASNSPAKACVVRAANRQRRLDQSSITGETKSIGQRASPPGRHHLV